MVWAQVSQSGGYVSTVDKHTVHVWSTKHPEWPTLKLHSTKALTVSHWRIVPTILMLVD